MNNKTIHHAREPERLRALQALQVLETPIEERFERITRLAQRSLGVPVSAISCVDHRRQWFKSIQGLNIEQTQRCVSFCQHTILQDEVLVIEDARFDPVFAASPLVTGEPGVVFYAGTPIYTGDGLPVAAMCVVDYEPRSFDESDRRTLLDLARLAEEQLLARSPRVVEHELIRHIGESWRGSLIDPLTRLWNHEGMATIITESLGHARLCTEHCALGVIDIPAFMRVNEALGHARGDTVLRTVAQELLRRLRPSDSIGRIRGDEFAVMLNAVRDESQAAQRLEHLRQGVERLAVQGIAGRQTLGAHASAVLVPAGTACSPVQLFEQLGDMMQQQKLDAERRADVRVCDAARVAPRVA